MTQYLLKHALYPALIETQTPPNLGLVVVIPCFNEKTLLPVLESLHQCLAPSCDWEVLVVMNAGENAPPAVLETNHACFSEAKSWCRERQVDNMHLLLFNDLPAKHAGVGMARKIGMDEAARRLPPEGIIINLDADCEVELNYLQATEQHFQKNDSNGCSIHFEHPFQNASAPIRKAIVQYEWYLRYFINMQRWAQFPWAFQTIGSAMAVRNAVYQQQGGMNKRKAGEDFYFLQKIIELGNFTDLTHTCVLASPRKSDRVPFGTGKAVNDIVASTDEYKVYHPATFTLLKQLVQSVPILWKAPAEEIVKIEASFPEPLNAFLRNWSFTQKVREIQNYTSNETAFSKRFFREFNAFQLMKFCHFVRDHCWPNVPIQEAAPYLYNRLHLDTEDDIESGLRILRNHDKSQQYQPATHL